MLFSSKRNLHLERKKFGSIRTNCHLLYNKTDALVIDPAGEGPDVYKWIKEICPKQKVELMLTHCHCDHMTAIPYLTEKFPNASILIGRKDLEFFLVPAYNYSKIMKRSMEIPHLFPKLKLMNDGDEVAIGDEKCKLIECPGHSPGSMCLYSKDDKFVIVGDTLFKNKIGDDDEPFADQRMLINCIKNKLLTLPDDTKVYPGHGWTTTIKDEHTNEELMKLSAKYE